MIIGVDIDDTLTDVRDILKVALIDYVKKIGKYNENIDDNDRFVKDGNKVLKDRYNLTDEELRIYLSEIHEGIVSNIEPREGVKEIIDKLKEEGNKIYIITARDYENHDDPYQLSKVWLEKNKIKYDKLIVNAMDKAKVCKDENVEIFIDDKLANCINVDNNGIKTIRITNYEEQYGNIVNKKNWYEIYDYIKSL